MKKKIKESSVAITFRLPVSLNDALRSDAENDGRSIAQQVRYLVMGALLARGYDPGELRPRGGTK